MIANIDRYQISRELGRGGMAVVYLATDPRIGREVAVKSMLGTLADDAIYRKRFNREVKTVAALEHPNIVPIYDYGIFDKQPFLVMRYMAGGTLAARLPRKPLSLAEAVTLMRRIAEALDEAHSRGIIHRDIKPANILLDQYGKAFLSDFGIVKHVDAATTPTDPKSLTGTPAYMSPEQIQGKPLDGRSDVYSTGAMLFELLSGQRPYDADAPVAVALRHITDAVPNILEFKRDLPKDIDRIITRAMAKSPQERYQTVGALAKDLAAVEGGQPISVAAYPAAAALKADPNNSPATMPLDTSHAAIKPKAAQSAGKEKPAGLRLTPVLLVLLGALALCAGGMVATLDWGKAVSAPPIATLTTPTTRPPAAASNMMLGGGTGQIAFVTNVSGSPDIFLLDVKSRAVYRLLTHITRKSDPSWSRSGKSLVFLSQGDGQNVIYSMSADGKDARSLLQDTAADYSPQWSPDGTKIAFTSKRDGLPQIYVMNADGAGVTQLTRGSSQNWKPSWSPDGKYIVFYSGRDKNLNIYRMDADGSSPIALVKDPAPDYDPAWSPDGKLIAFVSERDGNPEIYVMNADGTDQTRLTLNDAADITPAWSPDGSLIAFVSRRDGKANIYMMRADGSDQQKMTSDVSDDVSPAWQPADMQ